MSSTDETTESLELAQHIATAGELGPRVPHVVGIGVSAGSLDALEKLVAHLPVDSGLAFAIVHHVGPTLDRQPNLREMTEPLLLAEHTPTAIDIRPGNHFYDRRAPIKRNRSISTVVERFDLPYRIYRHVLLGTRMNAYDYWPLRTCAQNDTRDTHRQRSMRRRRR